MIYLLTTIIVSYCTSAMHWQLNPVPIKSAVVAGRATLVLTSENVNGPATELRLATLDGPGHVLIACCDIEPPRHMTVIEFPSGGIRMHRATPTGLPRSHSHSRHGLYVSDPFSPADGTSDNNYITGASLPFLEQCTERTYDEAGKLNADWTNILRWAATYVDARPLTETPQFSRIPKESAYFDIHVTDAAECELIVARPGDTVACYQRSVLPSRRMTTPGGHELKPWAKLYAVPGVPPGPFTVVPHKKARYLVTAAGSLVRIVGADGKPLAKAEVVFDKSPIRAVVHDADEGHWYAFTAAEFFEVAEPLALKPHKVAKFDTTSGLAGLETAFHCGRAVRGLPPVPFPADPADAKKKP